MIEMYITSGSAERSPAILEIEEHAGLWRGDCLFGNDGASSAPPKELDQPAEVRASGEYLDVSS